MANWFRSWLPKWGTPRSENNAAPLTNQQAQVIECSQLDGYQVSCFQTARSRCFHSVGLPEGDNLRVGPRAGAVSIRAHHPVESAA